MQRLDGGTSWIPVVWCNLEREPGVWNWTALDAIVRQARSLHLNLQFRLRVGACWLTQREPQLHTGFVTESEMPKDINSYAAFVRAVVTRYAALGVQTYAVENEPNTRYQWGGSLTQLLRLTMVGAAAVRKADPQASVADWGLSTGVYGDGVAQRLLSLHAGHAAVARYNQYYRTATPPLSVASPDQLAVTLGSGQDHRNLVYLRADQRLLHMGVFDVRQLHFYESTAILPTVIAYLRATTPADVPLEVWELGSHLGQDPQRLPSEMVRSVCLLVAAGAREVNWLPLAAPSSGNEPNLALLGAGGEPRPAGAVFGRLAHLVSEASTFRPLRLPDLAGLVMTRGRHTILVVWAQPGVAVRLWLPARSRVTAVDARPDLHARLLEVRRNPVLIDIAQPLATLRAGGPGLRERRQPTH